MPKEYTDEDRSNMRRIFGEAYEIGGNTSQYMTRAEVEKSLDHLMRLFESKIEISGLKQRNWVLAGCLAVIVALGTSYASLVSKLDKVNDVVSILDRRGNWMIQQDKHNRLQDDAIQRIDKNYVAPEDTPTPR